MVRALITDPVDEYIVNELSRHGVIVDYKPGISRDELLRVIPNYEVLVVRSRTKVTKDVIDTANKLRIIARAGVGLDNIDVEYAKSKGIEVINAPEGSTQSVAELVIGFMITAARLVMLQDRLVKDGGWPKGKYVGTELFGKVLGIIGFGRIGQRVAELARAIGMKVQVYDVIDVRDKAIKLGVDVVNFETLIKDSDFISIHVSLTPNAKHMISEREFRMMKDGVIIINTSRGEVIDTRALLKALNDGKVAAVALDVLENEPPREPWEIELVKHPRVIITPHIGAETREAQRRIAEILVNKVIKLLNE
ncbi:D-isomer specific 2-hydroxyacid dehydrogenase NAD-binding protein [Vulcanisaeta moutnovskia 768-28]|uniref:D-isomer specific 2-hydroxyacid dehydrogenase NAD-binding protein n=1 Tax=Vulcanisaeta moutnovskia (strain 768-28) TaxID=985053 RepID=F0QX67_VULM7|nr:D-2-hydroxyacid dehydrogenase [Vulcanisaeta moutnovskia]ADY02356.1 D-isomer specific 2-hydroxyacid dehydrogenase NAD-binding protein [Vulcanisaeta moutnovskia 768-28]